MSSANNKKHGELEEEFQRLMHDAEATPSPDLWARIDHDLTVMENKEYKKRFVVYRQLAAACFVLFVLAGSLLAYHFSEKDNHVQGTLSGAVTNPEYNSVGDEPAAAASKRAIAAAPAERQAKALESSLAKPSPATTEEATIGGSVPPLVAQQQPASVKQQTPEAPLNNTMAEQNGGSADFGRETVALAAQSIETGVDIQQEASKAEAIREVKVPLYIAARDAIRKAGEASDGSSALGMVPPLRSRSSEEGSLAQLLKNQTNGQAETLRNKQVETLTLALNNDSKQGSGGDESNEYNSRWSVDMAYMPSYFNQNIDLPNQMMGAVNYNSLTPQGPASSRQSSDNMEEAREEFDENTDAAYSFSMEVKTGFKLSKKLKLLTGIGYSQNTARTKTSYVLEQYWFRPLTNERYELRPTTIFLPSLNNNFSTDSLSVAQTDPFTVNYRYRLLSVPIGLQYEGNISKDWFWYSAAGVAANFLMETKVMATTDKVENVSYSYSEESPFRKVQFSGNVGVGVGKRISQSVQVVVGPEFRHFFSSMLAEPDEALTTQSKPYTIGVNMGVNYLIGRK